MSSSDTLQLMLLKLVMKTFSGHPCKPIMSLQLAVEDYLRDFSRLRQGKKSFPQSAFPISLIPKSCT